MANPVEIDVYSNDSDLEKKRPRSASTTAWNAQSFNSSANFDRKEWEALYLTREMRRTTRATFKEKLYNFMDRPKGWKPFTYHFIVFLLVFVSYVFGVLTTIPIHSAFAEEVLYYLERLIVAIFGVEYSLRLWAAGCRGKFQGFKGRVRYCLRPLTLIDLFIIITSIIFFYFAFNGQIVATSAIRGFRFMQIARMLHIDRQGGTWSLLKSVVISHKQELITTAYVGMLGLILSSYFLYLVEKDSHPDSFKTYADSLWWGIITMTTIGYGDRVPSTAPGKLLTAVCSLFTVSFFALPAGILGSGFALKVQQQQKRKKFNRQIPAAATLIQCAWRCYAAGQHFTSVATWKIPLKPVTTNISNNKRNVRESIFKRIRRLDTSIDNGEEALPTIGRFMDNPEKSKYILDMPRHSVSLEENAILHWQQQAAKNFTHCDSAPELYKTDNDNICSSIEQMSAQFNDSHTFTPDYEYSISSSHYNTIFKNDSEYNVYKQWILTQHLLTEAHKNAIRAIRKIKYFVALKKFQEARRPFEVSDVIEQYTQGQINMMTRIKELQRRLDTALGKPGSYLSTRKKALPIGAHLQMLEHEVGDIKNKMNNIDKKLDEILNFIKKEP